MFIIGIWARLEAVNYTYNINIFIDLIFQGQAKSFYDRSMTDKWYSASDKANRFLKMLVSSFT